MCHAILLRTQSMLVKCHVACALSHCACLVAPVQSSGDRRWSLWHYSGILELQDSLSWKHEPLVPKEDHRKEYQVLNACFVMSGGRYPPRNAAFSGGLQQPYQNHDEVNQYGNQGTFVQAEQKPGLGVGGQFPPSAHSQPHKPASSGAQGMSSKSDKITKYSLQSSKRRDNLSHSLAFS